MREREWGDALRGGDLGWFSELVEAYQHRVYALSLRRTGNPADAEDLAQEIFLQFYRKLPQFRFEAALSTWLYRVALNCAASYCRRRPDREYPLNELPERESGDGPLDSGLLENERRGAVHSALAVLNRAQRETLELFYFQRLSVLEIAGILRLSPRGVETRLRRARGQMKKALAATGYFEEVDEYGDGRELGEMASKLS